MRDHLRYDVLSLAGVVLLLAVGLVTLTWWLLALALLGALLWFTRPLWDRRR